MVTDIELDGMLEGTSDIEMPDAGEIEGDLELSPANELEGELEVPDSGDSLLGVNVNGVPQPVINRIADISVVTKVSQLDNDADYVTSDVLAETRLEVLNAIDEASSETLNQSREYTDGEINSVEDSVNVLADEIDSVKTLIPTQATEDNKLADKEFVNSSIATNTATFRGTFTNTSNFPQTATNNDYVFLQVVDSVTSLVTRYDRYKWSGTQWEYEYTLNNSSFTAAQWEAINSGATSDLIERLQDFNPEEYLKLTGGTITGDVTFHGRPNEHQYIKFFKDNAELYNFAIRNPYNGGRIEIGRVVRSSGAYSEIIRITVAQNKGVVAILSGELYAGQPSLIENKVQKYSDIYKQGIVSQTQNWTQQTDGSYSYTMSNQVTGNIPIYFIDIVSRLGAIFNENTGYFELSGLTDISYNEMLDIYATTGGHISNNTWTGIYKGAYCRTNIFNWFDDTYWGNCTLSSMGRDTTFEVLNLIPTKYINAGIWVDDTIQSALNYLTAKPTSYLWGSSSSFDSFVRDSKYIKHIRGVIRHTATNKTGENAFQNAYNLETVWLYLRNVDVNFENSPKLNIEVLDFIVQKRYTGTDEQSFTIKLHQTAYNKCILDTKQYKYGGQTYTGIRSFAASRNISIVSA